MPIEFAPPKYVTIVNTVQERIENGTYPPGATLPSETALMAEFAVSRPTAVRALELLRQQGWIDAHQGRGRTVIGPPALRARTAPAHARDLLESAEPATVTIVSAGPVLAPPRAAAALDLVPDTPVVARRRLLTHPEVGPVELSTVYVPVELAAGTAIGDPAPLDEGILRHVATRHRLTLDHASERISARPPTAEEARLLGIGRREVLLTVLLTVYDRTARPCVAVDSAYPATRHELADTFAIG